MLVRPGVWGARKALRPAFADRADLRERLLREGEWLTRCAGCRYVVGIHAIDRMTPALLLELVPGGTLADALRDDTRPGVGRVPARARVRARRRTRRGADRRARARPRAP